MKTKMIVMTLAATTVVFADETNLNALLIQAVKAGDADAARALMAEGADVNVRNESGYTALERAVMRANIGEGSVAIVKTLLDAGADVNAKGEYGRTALMNTAWAGDVEIIKTLIEAGADVDARSDVVGTALRVAVGMKKGTVVKTLLEAGADVNAHCDEGEAMELMMAASRYDNEDIMGMLLEAGADIDVRNANGETALMVAAGHRVYEATGNVYFGGLEVMRGLIAAGADVNAKDNDGRTALDKAWHADAIELLTAAVEGRELPPSPQPSDEPCTPTLQIHSATSEAKPEEGSETADGKIGEENKVVSPSLSKTGEVAETKSDEPSLRQGRWQAHKMLVLPAVIILTAIGGVAVWGFRKH